MSKKIYIVGFIFLIIILFFTVNINTSFSADLQSVPGQAIKIEGLTKNQFKSLPDNAVIEVNGIHMTKQQLIAVQKQKRNELMNLPKPSTAKPQFDAARTKFLQEQQNKLNAENARVKTAFDSQVKLNNANATKFTAIQKEALELSNKSNNATPEQQQQIEQRAKELVDQLKQMGYK
jgi:hypothetical protein